MRENSVLPGLVWRVIYTSVIPKSGRVKGPKIDYGELMRWARGKGEQAISLLRRIAQWLRLCTWISSTRTRLGSTLGDHAPPALASDLGF